MLLLGCCFGFLARESRYFSWLGPTMRMDKSCCWYGDFSAFSRGKVAFLVGRVCLVPVNTASCPVCGCPMIRHGRTSSGRQRWRCKPCQITTLNEIDSTAKHLDEFLAWLLGRRLQADMPGGGRSFRRRCEPLWQLWPFSPIVDEVHEVILVDGIHLGRGAVVLIAQTTDSVLGWYAARSENSRAWEALMSRIAPPALVVTDGGQWVRESLQENLADHACATLHLPCVLPYSPSHYDAPQTGGLTRFIRSWATTLARGGPRRCSGMDRCLPGLVRALEGLLRGENMQA